MTSPPARIDELKRQLAQLDELIGSGVLAGDEARARRAALELELLALVSPPAAPAQAVPAEPGPRPSRSLIAAVFGFVLVVGLAGYASVGRLDGWNIGPGNLGAVAEGEPTQEQVEAMVAQLAERLQDRPQDAEGWTMLARSYSAMGRHAEALPAFKKVLDLRPGDAQALADYADALAVANDRQLEGEPARLVMQALQADPANVKALALAGTIAFNRADYPAAVDYWQRAMARSDAQGPFARELQGALDEARRRAGADTAAAPAAGTGSADTPGGTAVAASISGEVRLGEALKAQASPDDTVFVFARPAEGPRMPLAILRLKVSDLPARFTLDDSMAMSPAARLSSVQQVVVGARVSKSGNAIAQAGDLEVISAPVAVGARDLQLEIAQTVR